MTLKVSAGLDFTSLELEVEPVTDRLLFLPSPLGKFCVANGLDTEHVLADEDQACEVICNWYVLHREAGGKADTEVESIVQRRGNIGDPSNGKPTEN